MNCRCVPVKRTRDRLQETLQSGWKRKASCDYREEIYFTFGTNRLTSVIELYYNLMENLLLEHNIIISWPIFCHRFGSVCLRTEPEGRDLKLQTSKGKRWLKHNYIKPHGSIWQSSRMFRACV